MRRGDSKLGACKAPHMATPDWAQLEAADGVRFSWCARRSLASRHVAATGTAAPSPRASSAALRTRRFCPQLVGAAPLHCAPRDAQPAPVARARLVCDRVWVGCCERLTCAVCTHPIRNVWPNTRLEAAKCVLPLGALYTPLRPIADLPVVPYDTVRCKGCAAVLNPYARVDFVGKARRRAASP